MGIENILSVASDLVGEVAGLKSAEKECKTLEQKVFMNQKRSILKKWNTSCMTEAVQQFLNLYQESSQELIRTS